MRFVEEKAAAVEIVDAGGAAGLSPDAIVAQGVIRIAADLPAGAAEPEADVVVRLALPEARIETADLPEGFHAHEGGTRMRDEHRFDPVAEQNRAKRGFLALKPASCDLIAHRVDIGRDEHPFARATFLALRGDLPEVAPGQFRLRLEGREGGAEIAGKEGDVGIDEKREGRPHFLQRLVGSHAEAARFFVAQQPHGRSETGDRGRHVGGVVDHHDFRRDAALPLKGGGHFQPTLHVIVDCRGQREIGVGIHEAADLFLAQAPLSCRRRLPFANFFTPMPKVTILPGGQSAEVPAGTLLLDAGEEAGVEMEAGCFNCSCGTCAVRVVSGMENIEPPTDEELNVLDQWNKDPEQYRLTCCVKVLKGDVVLRMEH